jgi:hypothetical protein
VAVGQITQIMIASAKDAMGGAGVMQKADKA